MNIIKWNDGFVSDTNDPIISAIEKCSNHPSIVTIKTREAVTGFFELRNANFADTFHEILRLDNSKNTSGSIPVKALKIVARVCSYISFDKLF